jgi:hypothetical protein
VRGGVDKCTDRLRERCDVDVKAGKVRYHMVSHIRSQKRRSSSKTIHTQARLDTCIHSIPHSLSQSLSDVVRVLE